ncbi:MAG TPA: biotin transporter BioY [Pyrinomonadaceae bacterium]|jgi:biotin transporter BioY
MNSYAKAETFAGALLAPLDRMKQVALVVAFSLLTALAAQVVIPLQPVPITGQTFAVLLAGALLGSRLGALAMFLYLFEGASGLPFFRGGASGVAYMTGATGGYLLAYPVAAYVVGLLAERGWDRRFLTAAAAMFVGSLIILAGGWLWLSRFVGAAQALRLGVAPFVIGDLAKIALAAAALPAGWRLVGRRKNPRAR